MKRARKSWHTKQNCMVRSLMETIRRSMAGFGQPITQEMMAEMKERMARSITSTLEYLPSVKVTSANIDGDMLILELSVPHPLHRVTLPPGETP